MTIRRFSIRRLMALVLIVALDFAFLTLIDA
jgi:hypothetical protein